MRQNKKKRRQAPTTKAVLKDSVVRPIGPLPAEWIDGTEVEVEIASPNIGDPATDNWLEEVCEAAANISDEDEELLARELRRIRNEAENLPLKANCDSRHPDLSAFAAIKIEKWL